MKTFLKNLGAIIVLLGVGCLACYQFIAQSNILLFVSLILEVVGIITYILLNKYLKD